VNTTINPVRIGIDFFFISLVFGNCPGSCRKK